MRRIISIWVFGIVFAVAAAETLEHPAPKKVGGMPLQEALSKRATARAFNPTPLPEQELSNLLWAAFGVNRADGRRTAPSARNFQETDIFVLLPTGTFRYDASAHRLDRISAEDIRALGGVQPFVKEAPVTLVYVVDLARMRGGSTEELKLTGYLDVGFVAQNICLYCASAGLANGVQMMIDRPVLAPKLQLRDSQLIVLAHSVGYPKP